MPDFIFELGHEEIPPGTIPGIINFLGNKVKELLQTNRLEYSDLNIYATCRRTSIIIKGLPLKQPDMKMEITGPPKSILFKDDKPTPALTGFLKKNNAKEKNLSFIEKPKGVYAVLKLKVKGQKTMDILKTALPDLIKKIPVPRKMRWDNSDLQFIRPIRNIFSLFNNKHLPIILGDLKSSTYLIPNPVAGTEKIKVRDYGQYFEILIKSQVILDHDWRRELLLERILKLVPDGYKLISDSELLDEVNFILENPIPILGKFNEKYLDLPRDILVYTLKKHQRFFSLEDKKGNLVPFFIGVADGERLNYKHIKKGFEEVLVARLEDAFFFFREDLKEKPTARVEKLKEIIFLKNFGTLYDKTMRIQDLSLKLSGVLELKIDPDTLNQAAYLSRNDLISNIITEKEYVTLQGCMGALYVEKSGADKKVAQAIYEMYQPKVMGDMLPATEYGKVLSIADRIDTLAVFFTAGKVPTGSADPFALRRAALGLILVILDSEFDFSLDKLLLSHLKNLITGLNISKKEKDFDIIRVANSIIDFIKDRLRVYLSDEKGLNLEIINAVFVTPESSITRLVNKVIALEELTKLNEFDKIKISFKRVINIIEGDSIKVDKSLLVEKEEQELYTNFISKDKLIKDHIKKGGFNEVFKEFLALRPYIDNFFDNVLVNCDDEKLRRNRMAMLTEIGKTFLEIANFKMIS
ncbi:glycine--tRNA ligase subunit beta [Candidatus Dependentiae bacterium]|nr:glycine--tRNA ligase subunit beta [Candidatus Dependentiae bacterium]